MHVSVIIPCLNEERTIEACICKAHTGLQVFEDTSEIIVADNGSIDNSVFIARSLGARVVHVKERGYGSAIMGGITAASGTYIVIGDADESYDFSVIPLFIEKLQKDSCDLVIGNRFIGTILPGAMPFLNRYLGNPVLSFIGRLLYGNVCGDFHCGLRAGRRNSLLSLNLSCTGMEFATEMIIKAARHKLKIGEVPITLYPDGRNRPPHLRPWRDGLRHLIFMLRYRLQKK